MTFEDVKYRTGCWGVIRDIIIIGLFVSVTAVFLPPLYRALIAIEETNKIEAREIAIRSRRWIDKEGDFGTTDVCKINGYDVSVKSTETQRLCSLEVPSGFEDRDWVRDLVGY